MKQIIVVLIVFLSCSGFSQEYQFTLMGKIPEAKGKTATLSIWDIDYRKTISVDTILLDDRGSFKMVVKMEPNLFVFQIAGIGKVDMAITNNQLLTIKYVSNNLVAIGSRDTDLLMQYEEFRKQSLTKWMTVVRANIKDAKQEGNDEKVKTLSLQENKYYVLHRAELSEWVFATMGTSISVYATSGRWTVDDLPQLKKLLPEFEKIHPNLRITEKFREKVYRFSQITNGALAIDIVSQDTSANTISLSDFRGKYVLIDFWASWCGPCRRENPTLLKVYNLYREKGFEIFGVALDKRDIRWKDAINKDEMTWVQVCDLEGYSGQAPFEYSITAIPSNILLDQSGRIISRNLFGPELEEMLHDIFEE